MTALPPSFSIVVPTYERPDFLQECVAAVSRLDYPRDRFELIIVDDGSSQPMDRVMDAAVGDINHQLIRQSNSGPARARNTGAAAARNDYLVFTDDDCQPRKHWLRAFADEVERRPDTMLGGKFHNSLPANFGAVASHMITDLTYDLAERGGRGTGPGEAWLFVTANLMVPRKLFLEVGGFDESFPLAAGEDFDFCHHFQHAGNDAGYCPAAIVDHYHPTNLRQFWRQHFGYGRGMLQFRRRATHRMGRIADRNLGPFQVRLAGRCLARLRGPRTWGQTMYVGVSQVAIIAGALCELRNLRSSERRIGDHS